jgi:NAD-dependent DNA ligase
MSISLDDSGQPVGPGYNRNRRLNRAISELHGLLRGIVADGYISTAECDTLAKWIGGNQEIQDVWPVTGLVERLQRIYRDNTAGEDERAELLIFANEIAGAQDSDTLVFTPTELPLSKPEPDVVFDKNEFVLTGRFLYGTRKVIETEIQSRGGICHSSIRMCTGYLVIGSLMSRDWKFTTYGNKIIKAVEYQQRCPIQIVSEKHWQTFLSK